MLHRYIIQHFFHLGLQFIQFFLIGVIRKHKAKHSFPFMHKPQQTATVANSTIVIQEVSIRPVQPYQHIRCGMKRYKQSFGTLAQYPVVKTGSFIGQHGFDSLKLYITAPRLIQPFQQLLISDSQIIQQYVQIRINRLQTPGFRFTKNPHQHFAGRRYMLLWQYIFRGIL